MDAYERTRSTIEDRFLGQSTNKVDTKGRLSIPAHFRKELEEEVGGAPSLYCFPSFFGPMIECGGPGLAQTMKRILPAIDEFAVEKIPLEKFITSQVETLSFDETGRVVLSKALRAHLGDPKQVQVYGMGDRFHIGLVEDHEDEMDLARRFIEDNIETMRARSAPSVTGRGKG